MKHIKHLLAAGIFALGFGFQSASAAVISLFEYAFNIDGVITVDSAPAGANIAGFDTTTGLGSITVTLSGAGSRYVGLFVDHEIDQASNTFFNEVGFAFGTPAAGQTWEIDEPGYLDGDIFENFQDGTLDNAIGESVYGNTAFPDDVSMALAWSFNLTADQTAVISFLLSQTRPTSGFYLEQFDTDSQASIFFSSSLTIRGDTTPIPTPGTLALLAAGLLLLSALSGRRKQA
jgi:hypothetical protein